VSCSGLTSVGGCLANGVVWLDMLLLARHNCCQEYEAKMMFTGSHADTSGKWSPTEKVT